LSKKCSPYSPIRTRTKLEELSYLIGRSYHKIMDYLKELGEEAVDVSLYCLLQPGYTGPVCRDGVPYGKISAAER